MTEERAWGSRRAFDSPRSWYGSLQVDSLSIFQTLPLYLLPVPRLARAFDRDDFDEEKWKLTGTRNYSGRAASPACTT